MDSPSGRRANSHCNFHVCHRAPDYLEGFPFSAPSFAQLSGKLNSALVLNTFPRERTDSPVIIKTREGGNRLRPSGAEFIPVGRPSSARKAPKSRYEESNFLLQQHGPEGGDSAGYSHFLCMSVIIQIYRAVISRFCRPVRSRPYRLLCFTSMKVKMYLYCTSGRTSTIPYNF